MNKYDIGLVYSNVDSLNDAELYHFIIHAWRPEKTFVFPTTVELAGKCRKFCPAWLDAYPWLVYSKYLDGCFCLPCVLFANKTGHSHDKLNKLSKEPLTLWTSASTRLKDHQAKSKVHHDSVLIMKTFRKTMENRLTSVDALITSVKRETIAEKRKISILETIILCDQQNFALRGHRDDSKYLGTSCNPGNFQALLDFRINAGDKILEDISKHARKQLLTDQKLFKMN